MISNRVLYICIVLLVLFTCMKLLDMFHNRSITEHYVETTHFADQLLELQNDKTISDERTLRDIKVLPTISTPCRIPRTRFRTLYVDKIKPKFKKRVSFRSDVHMNKARIRNISIDKVELMKYDKKNKKMIIG